MLIGLVLAGANRPETPGRGILTGEAIVGLDLRGLELAVLSACETGLGDVAGGEGVFGLQRAFHVAGCRNVVASLWKVDDEATAALMALFYRHLWEEEDAAGGCAGAAGRLPQTRRSSRRWAAGPDFTDKAPALEVPQSGRADGASGRRGSGPRSSCRAGD